MLKGKKVILRPVEERDLDLIVRWRNEPENRYFFFSPLLIKPGGQKRWYEELLADRNRVVLIIDTLEGKTVGMVSLVDIDWRNQACEIGHGVLDLDERGQGYMEEALEMIITYAFEELNINRISGYCYSFNPVIKLMKWFGFKEEGVLRQAAFTQGKFHDKVVIGLLREEWQKDGSSQPTAD